MAAVRYREGNLLKWGGKFAKEWKLYHFILTKANFMCFRTDEPREPKQQAVTSAIVSAEAAGPLHDKRYVFIVTFRDNSQWTLAAESEIDRQEWVDMLKPALWSGRIVGVATGRSTSRNKAELRRSHTLPTGDPITNQQDCGVDSHDCANLNRSAHSAASIKPLQRAVSLTTADDMQVTEGEHLYEQIEDCVSAEIIHSGGLYEVPQEGKSTTDSEYVDMEHYKMPSKHKSRRV